MIHPFTLVWLPRTPPRGRTPISSCHELARHEEVQLRALDAAREKAGLTKAELAAAIDARPEVVRRLITTKVPNPTLSTIIRLAAAVGYRIELVPDAKPKKASRRNAIV